MARRRWSEIPTAAKAAIIAAGVAQFALIGVAHADIASRPDSEIRGPKRAWRLACLVNFVGPAAYFALGRRRDGGES